MLPKFILVHDWKDAWKFISVNCMIFAAAIQGAWVYIPDDLRASMPHGIVELVTVALLALGVVGRVIKKEIPDVHDDKDIPDDVHKDI